MNKLRSTQLRGGCDELNACILHTYGRLVRISIYLFFGYQGILILNYS